MICLQATRLSTAAGELSLDCSSKNIFTEECRPQPSHDLDAALANQRTLLGRLDTVDNMPYVMMVAPLLKPLFGADMSAKTSALLNEPLFTSTREVGELLKLVDVHEGHELPPGTKHSFYL